MYKSAHACNRKLLLVCYNKNSVVTSCTLNYAYFGVVTETGGLSGRGENTEKSQTKTIRRECASAAKTDFKEKRAGLVPWCCIREGDACVCMVYLHYFCSPCFLIAVQLVIFTILNRATRSLMWHQFLLSPHLLPVRPLVWVHRYDWFHMHSFTKRWASFSYILKR